MSALNVLTRNAQNKRIEREAKRISADVLAEYGALPSVAKRVAAVRWARDAFLAEVNTRTKGKNLRVIARAALLRTEVATAKQNHEWRLMMGRYTRGQASRAAVATGAFEEEVSDFIAGIMEDVRIAAVETRQTLRQKIETAMRRIEELRAAGNQNYNLGIILFAGAPEWRALRNHTYNTVLESLQQMLDLLIGGAEVEWNYNGAQILNVLENLDRFEFVEWVPPAVNGRRRMGRFFDRIVLPDVFNTNEEGKIVDDAYDLLRSLGVYTSESDALDREKLDGYNEFCFFVALSQALRDCEDLTPEDIYTLRLIINKFGILNGDVLISSITPLCEAIYAVMKVKLCVQVRYMHLYVTGETHAKTDKFGFVTDIDRVEAKICLLNNHYFVDEAVNVPIYKSAFIAGDKVSVKPKGAQRHERPFSDTFKLMTFLSSDEALVGGESVKMISPVAMASRLHAKVEIGKISDAALKDTRGLHSMCRPVINKKKKALVTPDAMWVVDFETCGSSYQKPYMCQWGEFKDVTQRNVPVKVTNGRWCGVDMFNALTAEHQMGEADFDQHLTAKQIKYKLYLESTGQPVPDMRPKFDDAKRTIVMYAHNSGFDCSFIIEAAKFCGFKIVGRITNNGNPVSIKMEHREKYLVVELRDSYRVLMEPVRALSDTWKLGGMNDKEMMLHDVITPDLLDYTGKLSNSVSMALIENRVAVYNSSPYNKLKKFPWGEWKAKFISGGFVSDDEKCVRLLEYVEHYGKLDVKVVCLALEAFDKMMATIVSKIKVVVNPEYLVTPSNAYSSAGIADGLYKACGAFDGVYEIGGVLMTYLQGHIVGGRCQMMLKSEDYPFAVTGDNVKMANNDAVSLYPSAQDQLGSYPTGKPHGLLPCKEGGVESAADVMSAAKNSKWSAWFGDFRLKTGAPAPNSKLSLGLVAVKGEGEMYINSDGIEAEDTHALKWKNDLSDGKEYKFNYVSMPDFCKTTGIGAEWFELVRAVYFKPEDEEERKSSEGKLKLVVNALFNTRLAAKAEKNAGLDACCKLMLNSAYGRTILKWSDMEECLTTQENVNNAINRLGGSIDSWQQITNEEDENERTVSIISKKGLSDNWCRYHCGVAILAKSREIMNRVVHAAAEADIDIYYTDTDSLHHDYDKMDLLGETYTKLYPDQKPLFGKQMGQFHNDFEIKTATGGKVDGYSVGGIFLGKKCYFHQVVGEKDESVRGVKYSIKGITRDAFELTAAEARFGGGDGWNVFVHMMKGHAVEFDNRAGGKVRFSMGGKKAAPTFGIQKLPTLPRVLKFVPRVSSSSSPY
jgi:hypothetical protein